MRGRQRGRRSAPHYGGRARRSGFTMLELMIAIVVLLVGTLAAFATQVQSFKLIDASRDAAVAMTDLEVCLEELLALPADDIPVAFPPDTSIPAFEGLHLEDQRIVPTYPGYTAGNPIPAPLEIVLMSSWTDRGGHPRTADLVTVKSR